MAWKFTLRKGQEDRKRSQRQEEQGGEEPQAKTAGKKPPRDDLAGTSAEELERPSAAWFVRACALAR